MVVLGTSKGIAKINRRLQRDGKRWCILGGRFAVSRPTFDAMEAERVCRRLAAWVGCLGWVLGGLLGLVCLKVGCLELDKACYLATGRRLKGPFESCAPPSNKGKLCVCQLNPLTLIHNSSLL